MESFQSILAAVQASEHDEDADTLQMYARIDLCHKLCVRAGFKHLKLALPMHIAGMPQKPSRGLVMAIHPDQGLDAILDQPAVTGPVRVMTRETCNPVVVPVGMSPTWRNMLHAADQLIVRSGDLHHVFLELLIPIVYGPHTVLIEASFGS